MSDKTPYRLPQSVETSKLGFANNHSTFGQPQSLWENSKKAAARSQNEMVCKSPSRIISYMILVVC